MDNTTASGDQDAQSTSDSQTELKDVQTQIAELKKKESTLLKLNNEAFSFKKFFKGLNLFDPVGWAKWVVSFARTIVVLALVAGIVFGCGYWKGRGGKPVNIGYKDFTAEIKQPNGDVHKVESRGGILYFDNAVVTRDKIKDLAQFGIHIRPKLFFGIGSGFEPEIGAGFQLLEYRKFNLDIFGTQKAAYIGVSYDLELPGVARSLIQNSSVGVAVGRSWDSLFGDDVEAWRGIVYWSIKF
jgi:hypothetical protein